MRVIKALLVLTAAVLIVNATTFAHCEIPCGIYNDSARVEVMREHVTTIEKSMKQINDLSSADKPDYNQLVRWVTNKEDHANQLQDVATQYFMFQRVKPADESDSAKRDAYLKQLTALHELTVDAMKAKQSTDLAVIERLRQHIDDFEKAYFAE